jgi:hypothetical protein
MYLVRPAVVASVFDPEHQRTTTTVAEAVAILAILAILVVDVLDPKRCVHFFVTFSVMIWVPFVLKLI